MCAVQRYHTSMSPLRKFCNQQKSVSQGGSHRRELRLTTHPYFWRPLPFESFRIVILELGFSGGSLVKNLPANAGDVGSNPGLGRSPGERNGNELQYSYLGNPMVGYSPRSPEESDMT